MDHFVYYIYVYRFTSSVAYTIISNEWVSHTHTYTQENREEHGELSSFENIYFARHVIYAKWPFVTSVDLSLNVQLGGKVRGIRGIIREKIDCHVIIIYLNIHTPMMFHSLESSC